MRPILTVTGCASSYEPKVLRYETISAGDVIGFGLSSVSDVVIDVKNRIAVFVAAKAATHGVPENQRLGGLGKIGIRFSLHVNRAGCDARHVADRAVTDKGKAWPAQPVGVVRDGAVGADVAGAVGAIFLESHGVFPLVGFGN